jgi:hypothetical protein
VPVDEPVAASVPLDEPLAAPSGDPSLMIVVLFVVQATAVTSAAPRTERDVAGRMRILRVDVRRSLLGNGSMDEGPPYLRGRKR